jgi:hypothetical protein
MFIQIFIIVVTTGVVFAYMGYRWGKDDTEKNN